MSEQTIEIILSPSSEVYEKNDPRWADQEEDLLQDIKREADKVERKIEPVEGMKGGLETIVVTLIPTLIPAVTELIKAWIGRDKGRVVTATIMVDGKPVEVKIDSKGMDKNTFNKVVESAILNKE